MSPKRYPLVIEKTATGYSAYSPDVPGCAAVGDTEEETRRNFQDALAAHFQAMRELGEPIPEPSSSVDYVEVAAQSGPCEIIGADGLCHAAARESPESRTFKLLYFSGLIPRQERTVHGRDGNRRRCGGYP
jgi:predicted RNase H-like HicB family nuclease